jgi:Domain of unknown function (DUF4919)
MKSSITTLCALIALSAVAARGQVVKLTPDKAERAKAAAELRLQYAASADYNPYESQVPAIKSASRELMKQHAYARAIAEADRGLEKDRYNISLLIIKASAYRALRNFEKAQEVGALWMSLMDSILVNGDGKDFASAFRVISVEEEYAVIQVLSVNLLSQSLVGHDGSEFDVMLVQDPESGKQFQLYFNIDLPKKWLAAKFAKTSGPPEGSADPKAATAGGGSAAGGKEASSNDKPGQSH